MSVRARHQVEAVLIKREVEQPHREDPVIVHIRLHHLVHNDDLPKAVANETRGRFLSIWLLRETAVALTS